MRLAASCIFGFTIVQIPVQFMVGNPRIGWTMAVVAAAAAITWVKARG